VASGGATLCELSGFLQARPPQALRLGTTSLKVTSVFDAREVWRDKAALLCRGFLSLGNKGMLCTGHAQHCVMRLGERGSETLIDGKTIY
jgi:hypothetical protein